MISISPVARLGFSVPGGRAATRPETCITSSPRNVCACFANRAFSSGRKTTWVSPSRSRKSMKMTPPWSRVTFTQPASMTSLPMSPLRSELQSCVRYMRCPKVASHSERSEESRKRLRVATTRSPTRKTRALPWPRASYAGVSRSCHRLRGMCRAERTSITPLSSSTATRVRPTRISSGCGTEIRSPLLSSIQNGWNGTLRTAFRTSSIIDHLYQSNVDRSKELCEAIHQFLGWHEFLFCRLHILDFHLWPFITIEHRNRRACLFSGLELPGDFSRDERVIDEKTAVT